MKVLCGEIHLDGSPVAASNVSTMRGALLGRGVAHVDAWIEGAAGVSGVTWMPTAPARVEPMIHFDSASGCVVVADALLFERRELAAKLDLEWSTAAPASDAELILRGYLRWGEDVAARLYGEFAFVVWNPRERVVYCARDGFGIRCLYVHHVPGKLFAFASSARAVASSPRVPWEIDEGRVADCLISDLEGIDHTSTFFRSVLRLAPGHWRRIEASGSRERRYYVPGQSPPRSRPKSDDEWAATVRESLERSVRNHVDRSGRVGSMLSGGLDSSSIAAVAADQLAKTGRGPLPTFSAIDASNPTCSETRAIRAMLERPSFAPRFVDRAEMHAGTFTDGVYVGETEEPFDAGMLILEAQYRAAAASGVDAVFDGLDADTLFVAPGHTPRMLRAGEVSAAVRDAQDQAKFWGSAEEYPPLYFLKAGARAAFVPALVRSVYRSLRRPDRQRRQIRDSLASTDLARRVDLASRLSRLEGGGWVSRRADGRHESAVEMAKPYVTCAVKRYRRVASRQGVEPRHPFLDVRFVELCLAAPDSQRRRHGYPKAVLRSAMNDSLPASVCWRRGKEHLGWSFSRTWLEGAGAPLLTALDVGHGPLARFVDTGRLSRCVETYRRTRDSTAAALLVDAIHLDAWLRRHETRPAVG